jgi:hypothetical protein
MTATYDKIATQTLGSTATDVTFSTISGTYTDLVLVADILMSGSQANLFLQLGNGSADTGSNYSDTFLSGSGSAASSGRDSSQSRIFFTNNSYPQTSTRNLSIIQIMNYSNTTTNKTVLIRSNNAAIGTDATVGLWRSTAAITVVKIYPANNSFAIGSTFTLYGIKAA